MSFIETSITASRVRSSSVASGGKLLHPNRNDTHDAGKIRRVKSGDGRNGDRRCAERCLLLTEAGVPAAVKRNLNF